MGKALPNSMSGSFVQPCWRAFSNRFIVFRLLKMLFFMVQCCVILRQPESTLLDYLIYVEVLSNLLIDLLSVLDDHD